MNNAFNPEQFRHLPVVAILRFFRRAEVEKLVPASMAGGLRNIEVTMNSEGAEDLIRLTCELVGGQGNVGAGTVTTVEEMTRALKAGASFAGTRGGSATAAIPRSSGGMPLPADAESGRLRT